MIILCGPSATGKSEIAKCLANKYGINKVITTTTRPIRINETNNIDYHFMSKDDFLSLKEKNHFVETMVYNDNFYGCGKDEVQDNKAVILDPEGVNNFLKLNDPRIIVFVLEASEKTRFERMITRQDQAKSIKERIEGDKIRFSKENLAFADYYIPTDDRSVEEITDQIYQLYCNKIKSI